MGNEESEARQNNQDTWDLRIDMSGILLVTDSKSDCLDKPPSECSLMSQDPFFFVCAKGKAICTVFPQK